LQIYWSVIKGRVRHNIIFFSLNGLAKSPTITQRACNSLCEVHALCLTFFAKSSVGVSSGVPARSSARQSEVLLLDVVNNERESFGFLTVVDDGYGRGALCLSWVSFLVVLAVTEPDTNVVTAFNADHGDAVRLGEGGDELLVLWVVAVVGEDAKECLLAVKSLANFIESLDETYIDGLESSHGVD